MPSVNKLQYYFTCRDDREIPATVIKSEGNRIYHTQVNGGDKEPVSNFGITVDASVDVSPDVSGPGLFLSIKRYPENAPILHGINYYWPVYI